MQGKVRSLNKTVQAMNPMLNFRSRLLPASLELASSRGLDTARFQTASRSSTVVAFLVVLLKCASDPTSFARSLRVSEQGEIWLLDSGAVAMAFAQRYPKRVLAPVCAERCAESCAGMRSNALRRFHRLASFRMSRLCTMP